MWCLGPQLHRATTVMWAWLRAGHLLTGASRHHVAPCGTMLRDSPCGCGLAALGLAEGEGEEALAGAVEGGGPERPIGQPWGVLWGSLPTFGVISETCCVPHGYRRSPAPEGLSDQPSQVEADGKIGGQRGDSSELIELLLLPRRVGNLRGPP